MERLRATENCDWLSLVLACLETARLLGRDGASAVSLSLPSYAGDGAADLAIRLGTEWGLEAKIIRDRDYLTVRVRPRPPAAGSRRPAQ